MNRISLVGRLRTQKLLGRTVLILLAVKVVQGLITGSN